MIGLGTAAAISAAGSLAGSSVNAISQGNLNRKNRAYQEQAATTAYNRSLEMWNKTNEYNSPMAQMQRYQDAGLNPNLIYGQGNSGNASSFSAPQAGGPNTSAPKLQGLGNLFSTLTNYQDFKVKRVQEDNLYKQGQQIDANTLKILADTNMSNLNAAGKKMANDLFAKTFDAQADAVSLKNDQIRNSIMLNDQNIKNLKINYKLGENKLKIGGVDYDTKLHDYNLIKGTKMSSNSDYKTKILYNLANEFYQRYISGDKSDVLDFGNSRGSTSSNKPKYNSPIPRSLLGKWFNQWLEKKFNIYPRY